jgi:glyoxylase-like metal-dependent hydrolase (beta-lactamase superfamily II)
MATVDVLFEGYANKGPEERTASTVSLIRDAEAIVVVDPGLVPERSSILQPLAALGLWPDDVTDVVFSHHHPDHTLNAALFPQARFHDTWAIYQGDMWDSRPAEGFEVSPHVKLLATPGHTPEDITTVATTDDGVVALTHLWWFAAGPPEDPYAADPALLHANRARILDMATLIVPGHGPAFTPGPDTPR